MMEESTAEKCLICFESITDCLETSSTVEKTECEHVFHSHCLSEWFRIGVPGNYCPFCRSAIPGMEAVTSEAEEEESEQSFASSGSNSEESSREAQQQTDQISEEDSQSYLLQMSLEVNEELIKRQDKLVNLQTKLARIQGPLSRFISTRSSEQQEEFDTIIEIISAALERINNIQELVEKTREMISRASQALERSTIIEMMIDLKDMNDNADQHVDNVMELFERLFSMNILQDLINGANE